MGKKVITISLSEKSVQNAIRELRAYHNSLTYKCQLLAEKLAEKGVEIARVTLTQYLHRNSFLVFTRNMKGAIRAAEYGR